MSINTIKILKPLVVTIGATLIALSSVNVANAFSTKCPGTTIASNDCASCHGNGSPTKANGSCPRNNTPAPTPTLTPKPTPTTGGNTGGNTGGMTGGKAGGKKTNKRKQRSGKKSGKRKQRSSKKRGSRDRKRRSKESGSSRREHDDDDD